MNAEQIALRARAHFDKMRGQSVEVPEWGDDDAPLEIYFDPPSMRQRQQLKQRGQGQESRQVAMTVILLAKDKDGKALFADDAETLKLFLNDFDPAVIARVATRILGLTPGEDLGN